MGLVLGPGDAVVSKMGTVSAPLVLSFKGRVLRWREKGRGGFTFRGREQARESRATGLKGVRERRVGGRRVRERQRKQKEETRTKCQIERGRKTHTAAHRERSEEAGEWAKTDCWGLGPAPS